MLSGTSACKTPWNFYCDCHNVQQFIFLLVAVTARLNDFWENIFVEVKKNSFISLRCQRKKVKKCVFYVFCHRTWSQSFVFLSLLKFGPPEVFESLLIKTKKKPGVTISLGYLKRTSKPFKRSNITVYTGREYIELKYPKYLQDICWKSFSLVLHKSCATFTMRHFAKTPFHSHSFENWESHGIEFEITFVANISFNYILL